MLIRYSIPLLCLVLLLHSSSVEASWKRTGGPSSSFVAAFAVSGERLFAGLDVGGVYLSTDTGRSWTAVNTGLTNPDIAALLASGSNLFAGTWLGGLFLSTNGGAGWTAINEGLPNAPILALAAIGTDLYAGVQYHGIFRSTNAGTTWAVVNDGLSEPIVTSLVATDTNLFAGTPNGLFRSTNRGASWSIADSGLTNINIHCLLVRGTDILAGTYGGGVFLSTNYGTSWTAVGTGLAGSAIHALAISGDRLFAATDSVRSLVGDSRVWNAVSDSLHNVVSTLAVSGAYLFAGLFDGGGIWMRPIAEMATSVPPSMEAAPSLAPAINPNPARDELQIRCNAGSPNADIDLFDVLGERVMRARLHASGEQMLDVRTLPAGMYFLSIRAGAAFATRAVTISR